MVLQTQWTWVWASSGRLWGTGKPHVLQSMGFQRVRHDWVTKQPHGSIVTRTKPGFFHPTHSKANLLTGHCGKENQDLLQGAKQGEWSAYAQKIYTPQWLSRNIIKSQYQRCGCKVFDQFMDMILTCWWWGNREIFQESQPSTFWFWFQLILVLCACDQ